MEYRNNKRLYKTNVCITAYCFLAFCFLAFCFLAYFFFWKYLPKKGFLSFRTAVRSSSYFLLLLIRSTPWIVYRQSLRNAFIYTLPCTRHGLQSVHRTCYGYHQYSALPQYGDPAWLPGRCSSYPLSSQLQ